MATETTPGQIEIFLDGGDSPIGTYRPPARFHLDTEALADGPHELRIVATDRYGHRGVRTIPFEVRNGPGIAVDGLKSGDLVEGRLELLVNAYGGAHEENWEPSQAETPAPIPTWAWVLFLGIVAWAMFYAARMWSPSPEMAQSPTFGNWSDAQESVVLAPPAAEGAGASLYRTSCASCHQTNGLGLDGVFPPLAGDPVVTDDDATRHIEIILFGLQGQSIDGVTYPTAMPGWAAQLSDAEIAAVANHERLSWGNQAPTITAAEVAEIRRRGAR